MMMTMMKIDPDAERQSAASRLLERESVNSIWSPLAVERNRFCLKKTSAAADALRDDGVHSIEKLHVDFMLTLTTEQGFSEHLRLS